MGFLMLPVRRGGIYQWFLACRGVGDCDIFVIVWCGKETGLFPYLLVVSGVVARGEGKGTEGK